MRELVATARKTVVFLGKVNEKGEREPSATGFLLRIENIFHLATAKHVVMDPETGDFIDSEMQAFFNLKDGGIGSRSVGEIKRIYGVDWIFHPRGDVDIAIMPFGLNPADDVAMIPQNMFLTADNLFESLDVFFLSYQPGIRLEDRVSPIVRSGAISLMNNDETFYIDAAAFPGNSGSPVFLKPSPIRFHEKGIIVGADQVGGKFVGIIGEYIPYQEVAISAQTGRPRVIFEENTGLSRVWSVSLLKEILDSEATKRQVEQVGKKGILPPASSSDS